MGMRLYRSQVPRLAEDIINTLALEGEIVVSEEDKEDAQKDVAAIMEEYLRQESRVVQRTREVMERGQITYDQFGRVKGSIADETKHPTGVDGIRWIAAQIIESFMISRFIDEVFGNDRDMKRSVMKVFHKHLIEEADLDKETRGRLKNIRPGSPQWDIEYKRVMTEVRRKRGLV